MISNATSSVGLGDGVRKGAGRSMQIESAISAAVTNVDNVTLNITSIAITGANSGYFLKSTSCGSTLGPGAPQSCHDG